MRYHLTPVIKSQQTKKKSTNNKFQRECVKKTYTKNTYTVGRNVNWWSHYGKQYGGSLKKLKIEIPCDTAIPFLGIYLEKTLICKEPCTSIFIEALFKTAKIWKQPKCPLTDESMKKICIHTMKYYSSLKKNEIMPFAATWMNLEIIIVSEISQSEREIQIPYGITYM